MNIDRVAIVGAGRVGLSLARALVRSGTAVTVLGRESRALPEPLPRLDIEWADAIANSPLVIVAVPDDEIGVVATHLASTRAIARHHVVIHTSGLHDRSALDAIASFGAALGSWHPLQTFARQDGDPGALAGSPAVIEGDSRAIEMGRALATRLHLRPIIEVPSGGKAAYHAGAVFASNYLVVLAEIAARLARDAGIGEASAELYLPLMRRTLANYGTGGANALTGPISRGDEGTVALHLRALQEPERGLYVALGLEALRVARTGGLDETAAGRIELLLTGE